MVIRKELPDDRAAIREINVSAFQQSLEADIVDALRERCADVLSLVAVENDHIVGHILFSPARLEGQQGPLAGMALAPMAVLPEFQRMGIGSALVQKGLEELKDARCPYVIVLGHPQYYPRFGFERASAYGIRSQWEGIPNDAFMILWLDTRLRDAFSGVARYRDEFDAAV